MVKIVVRRHGIRDFKLIHAIFTGEESVVFFNIYLKWGALEIDPILGQYFGTSKIA